MASTEQRPGPTPRVTVITATYNLSDALRLALASLLAQEFTDFEAWVIGDGCTDDSAEVVASLGDPRVQWHNLPTNCGSQWGPNNAGLERARGEYVAYLGHDDLWFPWHLGTVVAGLEEAEADLVYSLGIRIGAAGVYSCSGPAGLRRHVSRHMAPPSTWLHRRDLVDRIGNWGDQAVTGRYTDHDYLRRATASGRVVFLRATGALKFPSHHHAAYGDGAGRPQAAYWARLQADPRALERELLLEFAEVATVREKTPESAGTLLRWSAARVVGGLLDRYGRDRWPVSALERWRFRRNLAVRLRQRGLTPK